LVEPASGIADYVPELEKLCYTLDGQVKARSRAFTVEIDYELPRSIGDGAGGITDGGRSRVCDGWTVLPDGSNRGFGGGVGSREDVGDGSDCCDGPRLLH
jgi:hypothetical protein